MIIIISLRYVYIIKGLLLAIRKKTTAKAYENPQMPFRDSSDFLGEDILLMCEIVGCKLYELYNGTPLEIEDQRKIRIEGIYLI